MLRPFIAALLFLSACSTATSSTQPPANNTPVDSAVSEGLPATLSELPEKTPLGPNLILNGNIEMAGPDDAPAHWNADRWGENTGDTRWEKDAKTPEGQSYLVRSLQNYSSGDAKWIFDGVNLQADRWYEYTDSYRSDGRNRLIMLCQNAQGQRFFNNVWQTNQRSDWGTQSFRFYGGPYAGCQASVMHVLDRNGFLHTDQHQLREVSARPLQRPLVSITFDDIWKSVITEGMAALDQRGWKGSFYITRKFAESLQNPEYAKTSDVQKLIQSGHEIGAHGDIHSQMSTLSDEDIHGELNATYNYLKSLGQVPEGIAYPFGDFAENVERETQRFHSYARTSLVGLNDKGVNRYRLRIVPVTDSSDTATLKRWVDFAKQSNTWVIFLFHDLSDNPEKFEYTTSLQQYKEVLDHIEAQKLTVLPVKTALDEVLGTSP
jgi:peptidoglycan/xylan/chitin deacetylase (PgdA/CDA1 family)